MTADLFAKVAGAGVSAAQVDESDRRARRVLCDIVARLGLDVVVGATGLTKSHIRQALDGEDGRYFDQRLRFQVLRFATEQERTDYLDASMSCFGRKSAPVRPRSDKERLRDLEYRVAARFGESGVELIDDERVKP